MGIRINKCVGWGVESISLSTEELDFFQERLERLYSISKDNFILWLNQHYCEIFDLSTKYKTFISTTPFFDIKYLTDSAKSSKILHNNCVHYDDVYTNNTNKDIPMNNSNVTIVFSPIKLGKCVRHNDLIDYLENYQETKSTFVKLNRGIDPYGYNTIPEWMFGICLFVGMEKFIPKLVECVYTYWA